MMKHTWRVAQELMRLTPPVFGNFKCASRDTTFDGFHIPKGWKVFWVSYATHMDHNLFEDPNKFDPSRFESSKKSSYPPYTYIPFGAGPRICPGLEFARVEVLLIIHHFITNYTWTPIIKNEPIRREPMPYPAMGLPAKLRKNELSVVIHK
ncbi:cytochrome P450 716B1-like [Prunus yedoensis var. nudiflora]|uniref:Cytochrome P450 716B1-like n=1 Tax=Prunus yedoensis var. nudiflora TaxID=2094558 RepID=A0A314UGV2_PRUYE|nr:cytochrome P450 716B1-like [Prunus yedoensis var. nudiflora]